MRKIIIIPLLLISLVVSGTNYYVKTGGNDGLSGTSIANAWATISKVNSSTFLPGDSILFNKGDKFIGTLTPPSSGTISSRIIFGSYGTGSNPILTPNDTITDIEWTAYGSDGIYYTLDILYNPGNILIDWDKKIFKIDDNFMTNTNATYNNLTSVEIMAFASDLLWDYGDIEVYFWDAIEGLYAYDGDTTFIRFRDGEDPNDSILAISIEDGSALYVNQKRYITVQNISFIGGALGAKIWWINFTGNENVIVEDCYFENSDQKVYIRAYSQGVVIRNNTITNDNLSAYTPGAWDEGTTYTDDICYHIYTFQKNLLDVGQSNDVDQGVYFADVNCHDNYVYGNTIINCSNGVGLCGNNNHVYENSLSGGSSVGFYTSFNCGGSTIHDNYITNFNIPFRFQYVDNTTYGSQTLYVYRNKVYQGDVGELMYFHSVGNPVTSTIYFYNNSFVYTNGINLGYEFYISGGITRTDALPFIFINNIFSSEGYITQAYSWIDTRANLLQWYYNSVNGTYYESTPVWAQDVSNDYNAGVTFWDHSAVPDYTDTKGKGVIDAGLDISVPFTLGVTNYAALPGVTYRGAADIGYYETEEKIASKVMHGGKRVIYNGKIVIVK